MRSDAPFAARRTACVHLYHLYSIAAQLTLLAFAGSALAQPDPQDEAPVSEPSRATSEPAASASSSPSVQEATPTAAQPGPEAEAKHSARGAVSAAPDVTQPATHTDESSADGTTEQSVEGDTDASNVQR